MNYCRDSPRFDIEKVDLPDNHPFAVKKKVSIAIDATICWRPSLHVFVTLLSSQLLLDDANLMFASVSELSVVENHRSGLGVLLLLMCR